MKLYQYILQATDKASQVFNKIAAAAGVVDNKIDGVSRKLKNTETQSNKLTKSFGGLKTALLAAFSIGTITAFANSTVEALGNYEDFSTSLTVLLGNKSQADKLIVELADYAKKTPFELKDLQAATTQLTAYGFSAKEMIPTFNKLGNVAAAINAPIGDIAYLFGTIRTQGRAMTMDINQFANRGIPIWTQLEKITGKSGNSLRKLVESGQISYKVINQVFENLGGAGGKWAGLMDQKAKTVTGRISNLRDQFYQLQVELGQNLKPEIDSTIDSLAALMTTASDTAWSDFLETFADSYSGIYLMRELFGSFSTVFGDMSGAGFKFQSVLDGITVAIRFLFLPIKLATEQLMLLVDTVLTGYTVIRDIKNGKLSMDSLAPLANRFKSIKEDITGLFDFKGRSFGESRADVEKSKQDKIKKNLSFLDGTKSYVPGDKEEQYKGFVEDATKTKSRGRKSEKDGIDAITSGGKQNMNINIEMVKFMDTMQINAGEAQSMKDMEIEFRQMFARVLSGGVQMARQ